MKKYDRDQIVACVKQRISTMEKLKAQMESASPEDFERGEIGRELAIAVYDARLAAYQDIAEVCELDTEVSDETPGIR